MLTLEGYTLDGFKLTLSLPCDTVEQALRHLRTVVESGITPLPQDPDAQETKTITSVVRRVHTNKKTGKKTPVVDLYSSWQGDYGQFRFCGVYLNSPEDIAQFEAQSGLNLLNMPLYKSQGPLQRIQISRDDVEIACKPFTAHKVMGKEKDIDGSGKMQHTWDFAGYGASIQTAFQDTPAKPATQKSVQADNPAPTPPVWWAVLAEYRPFMNPDDFSTMRTQLSEGVKATSLNISDNTEARSHIEKSYGLLIDLDTLRAAAKEMDDLPQ